jgi:hypothetical protein
VSTRRRGEALMEPEEAERIAYERAAALRRVEARELTMTAAARLLGTNRQYMYELRMKYQEGGIPALAPAAVAAHGTPARYAYGCRCEPCRGANTSRWNSWAKRRTGVNPQTPHGASRYSNYGCRCNTCTEAHWARWRKNRDRARQKKLPSTHGYYGYTYHGCHCHICVEAVNSRKRKRWRQEQAVSLDRAHRRGFEWTGPELEIIARDDLTSSEKARLLERTLAAVQHMNRLVRIDPRKDRLAGVVRDGPG